MAKPVIEEKQLNAALFQFIFPFSLNTNCQDKLRKQLQYDGYKRFSLDHTEMENAYYGERYSVSHLNLERYYLPFTNTMLFPHHDTDPGLHRYSKSLMQSGAMKSDYRQIGFTVQSVDVFLCPFDLGFVTVRVELPCEEVTFTDALEFAKRFRVLQNRNAQDEKTRWTSGGQEFDDVEEFMFASLVPDMVSYVDSENMSETYFAKHPFFVDERMYVQGLFSFRDEHDITNVDLYRASQVDGVDLSNRPYVSSTNVSYIDRYVEKHRYDRWGPNTYYMTDESSFVCLTKEKRDITTKLANHMYGEYYYALLINLFHKIVLLKLSILYSKVRLDANQDKIEELIRSITSFSAKYYFNEVVSQSQGKEIFIQLRNHFGNEELFGDVKHTLADLYKYQENFNSKRNNYLLLILTIYTVVSGIYGMNQVIEDLKGDIDWSKLQGYSIFQHFAFVLTLSGIFIALWLGITTLIRLFKERRKKRD
ncbi:hypothetical protein KP806_10395 [Paenibacillus sp. N4]|uniref:hypothetical protein n=1 Tax=Paenibacillus vietnamensis TaxID=2590547 RepID=UPI001CD0D121|nr:hypothetical protein [Paenibacillus vietnamensis]MCA0755461.1 hypothetical protein [Paenibacillus vietnamensis]